MLDLKALAADLGNALGSGKTGALEIGGGVSAEVTAVQARIASVAQKAGVDFGKVAGSTFTDSLANGAKQGSSQTSAETIKTALNQAGISTTHLYIALAVVGVLVAYFISRRK